MDENDRLLIVKSMRMMNENIESLNKAVLGLGDGIQRLESRIYVLEECMDKKIRQYVMAQS